MKFTVKLCTCTSLLLGTSKLFGYRLDITVVLLVVLLPVGNEVHSPSWPIPDLYKFTLFILKYAMVDC
jgi:hypothetical protein